MNTFSLTDSNIFFLMSWLVHVRRLKGDSVDFGKLLPMVPNHVDCKVELDIKREQDL